MPSRRRVDGNTAVGALALYVLGLTREATLQELAEEFDRSSSSFGNYLNGTHVIPKQVLGKLVVARTKEGAERNSEVQRALALWKAATEERRAARAQPDEAPVPAHQRRDEAMQQVVKYQRLAQNADQHLAELRPMLAFMQSRLENARLRLRLAGDRERARIEREIIEARKRLERVKAQRERARSRRVTAEQQQDFWMAEVLAAQSDLDRLGTDAEDLAVPGGVVPLLRASADDTEFDARLEGIEAEGLKDDAEFDASLPPHQGAQPGAGPAGGPGVPDSVQDLSNTGLDKPLTGTVLPPARNTSRPPVPVAPDAPAGVRQEAGPEEAGQRAGFGGRMRERLGEAVGSVRALAVIIGVLAVFCVLSGYGTAYGAAIGAEPGASGADLLRYAGFGVLLDALFIAVASYRGRWGIGSEGLKAFVYLCIGGQFLSAFLSSLVDQAGPLWMAEVIGLL
ncbi:hypothetical protein [Streptomyces sp. NPDC058674]|uniref:hypothetical protein n=1 Tax=Streptomyces sp. NPDC058674 TaxID=3346592 RepID=UPI00364E49CB